MKLNKLNLNISFITVFFFLFFLKKFSTCIPIGKNDEHGKNNSREKSNEAILGDSLSSMESSYSEHLNSHLAAVGEKYNPKSCKYNPIVTDLDTFGYLKYNGEVYIADVFGISRVSTEVVIRFTVGKLSMYHAILTVSAELHRNSALNFIYMALYYANTNKPANKESVESSDVSRNRGHALKTGTRVYGAGGENSKVFLSYEINSDGKEQSYELVFKIDVSSFVEDSVLFNNAFKSSCFPIRLDFGLVPYNRIKNHTSRNCRRHSYLPKMTSRALTLDESGLSDSNELNEPYVLVFDENMLWEPFTKSVWHQTIIVPQRMNRFVRFLAKLSFRFITGPFQIIIELFDSDSDVGELKEKPSCVLGCLGGTPTYNGQLLDHALPTGYIYKTWVVAGEPMYTEEAHTQCMEFDFSYSVKFEERLTPFDIGDHSWMCDHARLPYKIIQKDSHSTEDIEVGAIQGRTILLRGKFGFPPDEVNSLMHLIILNILETSVFRATTHQATMNLRISLSKYSSPLNKICPTVRIPGSKNYETVNCILPPGVYTFGLYAEYPLGGLPPCDFFFAQIGIKPLDLLIKSSDCNVAESREVVLGDIKRSKTPMWKQHEIVIESNSNRIISVGKKELQITVIPNVEQYLRIGLKSDFYIADIRVQVVFNGNHLADPHPSSNEYVELLGPLEEGTYTIELFYVGRYDTNHKQNIEKICGTFYSDIRILERKSDQLNSEGWICKARNAVLPDKIKTNTMEEFILDRQYLIPPSGQHTTLLVIPTRSIVKIKAVHTENTYMIIMSKNSDVKLAEAYGDLFLEIEMPGAYRLVFHFASGLSIASFCSTVQLHIVVQPKDLIPACPWASGVSFKELLETTKIQKAAADHLGSTLSTDMFIPRKITHLMEIAEPKHIWMSPEMETEFIFETNFVSSFVRVEVVLHPFWLPLSIELYKKDSFGYQKHPQATAHLIENRVLLLRNGLTAGEYKVKFRMLDTVDAPTKVLCAHATVNTEIGDSNPESRNEVRAELLDMPELLPIETLPRSLNQVGWFSFPDATVLATAIYSLHKLSTTKLKVEKNTILRIVTEPAALSTEKLYVEVNEESSGKRVAHSSTVGYLFSVLPEGSYVISFQASQPFLITIGIISEELMLSDASLRNNNSCSLYPPRFPIPSKIPSTWNSGQLDVKLDNTYATKEGEVLTIPVELSFPSIVVIEIGSNFFLDFLRVGIKVPEGLWIGEQRSRINSLRLELSSGVYDIRISQPQLPTQLAINRCMEFSFSLDVSPLHVGNSRNAECVSYGAMPLPLDLTSKEGGSQEIGGPLDDDGRLFIRSKIVILDIHNGRKKVYLDPKGRSLVMKLGVFLDDRLLGYQISVVLQNKDGKIIPPTHEWGSNEGGAFERIYNIKAEAVWIVFKHEHYQMMESGCVLFDLLIQIHPFYDLKPMTDCSLLDNDSTSEASSFFPFERISLSARNNMVSTNVISTTLKAVKQKSVGILETIPFTLNEPSFVIVELHYNFLLSHVEMDLIDDSKGPSHRHSGALSVVVSDIDFVHENSFPTNTRQWIASTLEPGHYALRVADDHWTEEYTYASSSEKSELCFPMQFVFKVYSLEAGEPQIIGIHPDTSMPLYYGQDLFILIRFSVAPEGSEDEISDKLELVGSSGISLKPSEFGRMDSEASAVSWTFLWLADSVSKLGNSATLHFKKSFVSSDTGKPYKYNGSLEYTIYSPGSVKDRTPWIGYNSHLNYFSDHKHELHLHKNSFGPEAYGSLSNSRKEKLAEDPYDAHPTPSTPPTPQESSKTDNLETRKIRGIGDVKINQSRKEIEESFSENFKTETKSNQEKTINIVNSENLKPTELFNDVAVDNRRFVGEILKEKNVPNDLCGAGKIYNAKTGLCQDEDEKIDAQYRDNRNNSTSFQNKINPNINIVEPNLWFLMILTALGVVAIFFIFFFRKNKKKSTHKYNRLISDDSFEFLDRCEEDDDDL